MTTRESTSPNPTSAGPRSPEGSERQLQRYNYQHFRPLPTFSDALALVRKDLWAQEIFRGSPSETDTVKVPRVFVERLTEAVCYAA